MHNTQQEAFGFRILCVRPGGRVQGMIAGASM